MADSKYDFSDFDAIATGQPSVQPKEAKAPSYDFSDLDKPQAPKEEPKAKPEVESAKPLNMAETALVKIGDAVSFGNLDEATAALAAATDIIGSDKTFKEQYGKRLEEARKLIKDAEDEHPITAFTSELLGSLAMPVGAMGAVSKGATIPQKLRSAAKAGAVMGGLYGFGKSEAPTAQGVAKDVLEGAGGGAIMAPAAELAIGAGGKVLGKAKEFYQNNPTIQRVLDAFKAGQENPDLLNNEGRKRITEELHQSIERNLIPLFDDELKQESSKRYDAAKNAVNELVIPTQDFAKELASHINSETFDASDASRYVYKKLVNEVTKLADNPEYADVHQVFKLRSQIQDMMNQLKDSAVDLDGFRTLESLKNTIDSKLAKEFNIPLDELNKQFSKISDFTSKMGYDIGAKTNINAAKRAEETTRKGLTEDFIKASQDPASEQALKIEQAFKELGESGLISPEELSKRLAEVKDKAKLTRVMRDTYGASGFPGGFVDFVMSGGLGVRSLATSGVAAAGQISAPAFKILQKVSEAPPEALLKAAGMAKNSEVAKILTEIASQPHAKRRALIYTMMQQPSYREAVQSLFSGD